MEINKLHITSADYDFFKTLADKEKIEFLYDIQDIGLNLSVVKRLKQIDLNQSVLNHILQHKADVKQSFNDIFQDTLMEEHINSDSKIVVTIMNNFLHLNSSSLKLIKLFVYKLLNDGHLVIRHKYAKKLPTVDLLRYYRCYEIIGSGDPICPN